jgi:hypothetical protein
MTRFAFDFSTPLSWPLRLLGVSPWTAHVDVEGGEFAVRFGPWSLRTPVSNIASVQVTGPYNPLRSLGVHISLSDRGVTFGTTPRRGVCVTFRRPVAAALPTGLIRHPGVTVTVEDVDGLYELLQRESVDALGEGGTVQRITVPRRATTGVSRTSSRASSGAPPRIATPPRPARRSRRSPDAPTPADMPEHSTIRKLPGTDVEDEGLPPSDAELAAREAGQEQAPRRPVKRSEIRTSASARTATPPAVPADEPGAGPEADAASDAAAGAAAATAGEPTTAAESSAPARKNAARRAAGPNAPARKKAATKTATQGTPAERAAKQGTSAGAAKRSTASKRAAKKAAPASGAAAPRPAKRAAGLVDASPSVVAGPDAQESAPTPDAASRNGQGSQAEDA